MEVQGWLLSSSSDYSICLNVFKIKWNGETFKLKRRVSLLNSSPMKWTQVCGPWFESMFLMQNQSSRTNSLSLHGEIMGFHQHWHCIHLERTTRTRGALDSVLSMTTKKLWFLDVQSQFQILLWPTSTNLLNNMENGHGFKF